jgi:hypothetical protein
MPFFKNSVLRTRTGVEGRGVAGELDLDRIEAFAEPRRVIDLGRPGFRRTVSAYRQ